MSGAELSLLLAMWVQGALALVLLWVLGRRRLPRVRRGEIRVDDVALSGEAWPTDARQASNAFDNQFQLPVLFYLACGMTLFLGATLSEVVIAWLFVATRIVHAFIHVTSNRVTHRFAAYVGGYMLLVVFWLVLLVRLFTATGAA